MIYWKQTDVFGYPPHGVRVFAAYEGRIIEAMIVGTPAGDRWDIYDTPDGACAVSEPLPLQGITDWSEMNMPLTFTRKS